MKPIATLLFRLTGFCSVVVADSLGQARHLTVRENGDVYLADSMRGRIWRILYTGHRG